MKRTFRNHFVLSEEERERIVMVYLNSGDTIKEGSIGQNVGYLEVGVRQ